MSRGVLGVSLLTSIGSAQVHGQPGAVDAQAASRPPVVNLGYRLDQIVDLDGDGLSEFVNCGSVDGLGPVTWVLSLADGAVLDAYARSDPDARLIGDFDADGVADYGIFWEHERALEVYSGRTGEVVFADTDAHSLHGEFAGVGDVAGDEGDELAIVRVAVTENGPVRRVEIYTHSLPRLVRTIPSPDDHYDPWFGERLTSPGDLGGDGVPDLVVGAAPTGAMTEERSHLWAFDGATGGVLWEVHPVRLGLLERIPDLDDDGVPDLIVGWHPSIVRTLSGADGSQLYQLYQPLAETFGIGEVVVLADVDRDGTRDFAIADEEGGSFGSGDVTVFSGADGKPRISVAPLHFGLSHPDTGAPSVYHFGNQISGADDVDGDCSPDLLIAWCNIWNPNRPGGVGLVSLATREPIWVLDPEELARAAHRALYPPEDVSSDQGGGGR